MSPGSDGNELRLQKEITHLREQLEAQRTTISRWESDLAEAKVYTTNLESEVAAHREAREGLTEDLESAAKERHRLEERLEAQRAEIASVNAQLEKTRTEWHDERKARQHESGAKERELIRANREVKVAKATIVELNDRLEDRDTVGAELWARLKHYRGQRDQLLGYIHGIRSDRDDPVEFDPDSLEIRRPLNRLDRFLELCRQEPPDLDLSTGSKLSTDEGLTAAGRFFKGPHR